MGKYKYKSRIKWVRHYTNAANADCATILMSTKVSCVDGCPFDDELHVILCACTWMFVYDAADWGSSMYPRRWVGSTSIDNAIKFDTSGNRKLCLTDAVGRGVVGRCTCWLLFCTLTLWWLLLWWLLLLLWVLWLLLLVLCVWMGWFTCPPSSGWFMQQLPSFGQNASESRSSQKRAKRPLTHSPRHCFFDEEIVCTGASRTGSWLWMGFDLLGAGLVGFKRRAGASVFCSFWHSKDQFGTIKYIKTVPSLVAYSIALWHSDRCVW